MKQKESPRGKLSSSKDRIIRFLSDGDVVLAAEELKMLARWELADRLLQQKKPHPYIVAQIEKEHHVSRFTANNDIYQAQQIFSAARLIDKKYILYQKFLRQESDIERTRKKMAKGGGFEDPKMLAALAKMEEASTYTMNSIPWESKDPLPKRPVFVFASINNSGTSAPMAFDEAMNEADNILKIKAND